MRRSTLGIIDIVQISAELPAFIFPRHVNVYEKGNIFLFYLLTMLSFTLQTEPDIPMLDESPLGEAQGRMKGWHDPRAKHRAFSPGDKGLLLPLPGSALQA